MVFAFVFAVFFLRCSCCKSQQMSVSYHCLRLSTHGTSPRHRKKRSWDKIDMDAENRFARDPISATSIENQIHILSKPIKRKSGWKRQKIQWLTNQSKMSFWSIYVNLHWATLVKLSLSCQRTYGDCQTFMMVMMMTSMFQDFKMFLRCFVAILYSLRFVWHGAHASSTWVAVKVGKNCGRH